MGHRLRTHSSRENYLDDPGSLVIQEQKQPWGWVRLEPIPALVLIRLDVAHNPSQSCLETSIRLTATSHLATVAAALLSPRKGPVTYWAARREAETRAVYCPLEQAV